MSSETTISSNNASSSGSKNKAPSTEVVRLNVHERLQHLIIIITFLALVSSGYVLQMPEAWILKLGDTGKIIFYYRGLIHRIAAVGMILCSVYHVLYLIIHPEGRSFIKDMIPTLKDVKDIFQNLAYFFGKRSDMPEFDRFDYREKAEYLALAAGTVIITVTGIMLWTETYWSKFALDLALLIHGMEAILATLAIIVWHFYAVHYKPGKFPMSWVWITGKMPLHEMEEEHPLYYKRLVEQGIIDPDSLTSTAHEAPKKSGFGKKLFEMIVFVSIIFFLAVSVLLIKRLYFPLEHQGLSQTVESGALETFLKTSKAQEKVGHFHNVDETINPAIANPVVCVQCHGNYPHSKSPDLSSFLNMHNYFMACETCHVHQNDMETPLNYVWFDNQTDETVEKIIGDNGVYGARLVPVLVSDNGGLQRLDYSANDEFVEEYLKAKNQLTSQELTKAKTIFHKDLSKKPVQCTECHGKEPYIDFAAVGYTHNRAQSLYRTEVADMIDRYMKFYLPTMFDADLIKKQKIQELEKENRSTD